MDHDCKSSLDSIPDENAPKPWPVRKLIGVKNITARIGPTGGKRGYEAQTGKFQINLQIKCVFSYRSHLFG